MRSKFDREKLPDPEEYYSREIEKFHHGQRRAYGICPFHDDRHSSLGINLSTGSFRCYACGESGRDVLEFQMKRYFQDFKEAAQELGAWG